MEENRAEEQAKLQLESIREMLAALNVDYERLEELKDELEAEQDAVQGACDDLDDIDPDYLVGEEFDEACEALQEAEESLYQWGCSYGEELADLIKDAGDCESREDAEQRIHEDPLDVEIRGGWYTPGSEDVEPEDFQILLCTGGPAVRIRGELDNNHPSRAWLEYQDWGTPWQIYFESGVGDVLVEYANQFYFGE